MSPVPPIFVIDRDGGDILTFDEVGAAEGFMEPPEVREGAYLVFDSLGHQATLGISGWDAAIEAWSSEASPVRLRELLTKFLADNGQSVDDTQDLPAIVTMADRLARDLEVRRTQPRIVGRLLRWRRDRRRS